MCCGTRADANRQAPESSKGINSYGVLEQYRKKNAVNRPPFRMAGVADTVSGILDKQEYCGDTVNFRTYRKSFKMKKKLDKPKDEWKIISEYPPCNH